MIVAPANTPNAIVNKLHSALKGILELPEIQQQLINLGMIPISSPAHDKLPNCELGHTFPDSRILCIGPRVGAHPGR